MRKLILLSVIVLFSCSERDLPTLPVSDEPVELVIRQMPEVLNPNRSFFVAVQAKGERNIDWVELNIIPEAGQDPVQSARLYDDGGAQHPNDGDIVAHDNVFSQNVLWNPPSAVQQNYRLQFVAKSEEQVLSDPLEQTVLSLRILPPRIVSVEMPDLLPSGYQETRFINVGVQVSSGLDDISEVLVKGFQDDTQRFIVELQDTGRGGDILEGDGIYSASLEPFFAARKKGSYDLIIIARDRSGSTSEQVKRTLIIENQPPVLSDPVLADSVARPASGQLAYFLIEINARDPQTLQDISDVILTWKKPDGTFSANSPFTLYDNGLAFDIDKWNQGYRGDKQADDGIYSITGIFDDDDALGTYILEFIATDWVGQKSEPIAHKVKLVAQ